MQAVLAFIAMHVVLLLSAINHTGVSVALLDITGYYDTSLVVAGWVLIVYQLVAVCTMVLMGKIGDIYGRKRVFLTCAILFTVGSLLAALAPNIQLLIAARFVQSIGGGGFLPLIVGIITDIFPRHRRVAIGVGMSVVNVGGIIGPNIGAWLITTFGWQSIFWFNVPLMVIAIVPLFFLLKSERGERASIDYAGAGYLSLFLVTFMLGISWVAESENTAGWLATGLLLAVSLAALVVFVRHEFRTRDPIIDLDLLRRKAFLSGNIYIFIYGLCVLAFTSLIPTFVISVYNMTTAQSGYVMATRAVGAIVAATGSSLFLVRWGYRRPLLLGSIIASVCLLALSFNYSDVNILGLEPNTIVLVSLITLFMGLGHGIAGPAINNACIDLLPERASTIAGVLGLFRQGGGAIGIAVFTVILQFFGDYSVGFRVIYIASGIMVLLTVPLIFAVPAKAVPLVAKKEG